MVWQWKGIVGQLSESAQGISVWNDGRSKQASRKKEFILCSKDAEQIARQYDQFGTCQIPYKRILEDVTVSVSPFKLPHLNRAG